MIPLKDDNPTRTYPYITLSLVAINVAVYIWEMLLPEEARDDLIYRMAVIPVMFSDPQPFGFDSLIYNSMTLVTAMFLHAGLLHLLGNVLYLWIFGNNVEDVMGHGRFAGFYFACGIAGSLAQIAIDPRSDVPMIGASGAIAGVLGAYLVQFPTARVVTLIFVVFIVRIVRVPALILLGVWLLIQLLNAGGLSTGGVAWFAHIGGFTAGLTLIVFFRRRRPRDRLY